MENERVSRKRVDIGEGPGKGCGREVDVSQRNVRGQDATSFDTGPEAGHSLIPSATEPPLHPVGLRALSPSH